MSRFWPPASSCAVGSLLAKSVHDPEQKTSKMTTRWALALTSLLALSGCASVQVHLGMKVYLAKTPIASMKATLPKGPAIGPGEKLPLVVVVTEPDGKVLQTEGAGSGKVMWKDLKVTATVATSTRRASFPSLKIPGSATAKSRTSPSPYPAIPI